MAAIVAGCLQATTPTAEQRTRGQMAAADATLTGAPQAKEEIETLLRRSSPGIAAAPVLESLEFPVLLNQETIAVHYRETDWSAPVVEDWVEVRPGGSLPTRPGQIAVSDKIASTYHLDIGDTLRYRWSDDAATVTGIVREPLAYGGGLVLAAPGQSTHWQDRTHDREMLLTESWLLAGSPGDLNRLQDTAVNTGLQFKSRTAVLDGRSLIEKEPGVVLLPGLLLVCVGAAAAFGVRVRQLKREFSLLSAIGLDAAWILGVCRLAGLIASLSGSLVGFTSGTVLSTALRPVLRDTVQHDLSPIDIPWVRGVVLVVLTAVAGTAAVWLPARAALTGPVQRQLAAAPDTRSKTRAALAKRIVAGFSIAALSAAFVVSSRSASSVMGLLGCAGLCAAALMVIPTVLRVIATAARDTSVAGRVAMRSLAREPRRPVAAVAIGFFSVCVATATLTILTSSAADAKATYVGSRHLGQIEVVLRHTTDITPVRQAFEDAAAPAPVTEVKALIAARPAATTDRLVALPWNLAPATDVDPEVHPKSIQAIDTPDEFRALTGRAPTAREQDVLDRGGVLVLAAPYIVRTQAMVLAYDATGQPKPVRIDNAQLSDPVDAVTLNRAGALMSSRTAAKLGATVQTQTLIATSPNEITSATEDRTKTALERLGIPGTDLRIEHGPSSPPQNVWYILLTAAGAAVIASLAIALSASAQELRPDLRRLHDMGFHRAVQRRILAYQSLMIAALATVAGAAAGLVLAAARLWPYNAALTVDWTTLLTAVVGVLALSVLLGAMLAPKGEQLRASA
ncbi:hypothetical protein [Kitasatospora sp. NPDC059673]|uniref:hypothetical protein n=1 Tax=Kitasatospora sp. NPDC059673 TaxID=3346901 RepID=UPI0036B4C7C3